MDGDGGGRGVQDGEQIYRGFRMGNTEIHICVAEHRHRFHEALNLDKLVVQSTHKGQVPQ